MCEPDAPMVNLHLEPVAPKLQTGTIVEESSPPKPYSGRKNCTMPAKAILTCRGNSHHFHDRSIVLDHAIKVGRSVAHARPAVNNAYFDCKVLSRNHAKLWFDKGTFFLQDTKSSNGTFVNNQRLSKGSELSVPRQLSSGDIVQFGVDVVENCRKVMHGCIIATIKLYLPDGTEAIASSSSATVDIHELCQLSKYLQEALHREQMLENKLKMLQTIVSNTEKAAESSWKALIDEDRLLSRLEMLEYQVQMCSKNVEEDSLRQEVLRLQGEKDGYQVTAKELLKKVLQEKLEAVKKLHDAERSLSNAESECKNLLEQYEATTKELQDLRENYVSRLREIQDLTDKLRDEEEKPKLNRDNSGLIEQQMWIEDEDDEDNELCKEQNSSIKDDPDFLKISTDDKELREPGDTCNKHTQGVQVNLTGNDKPVFNSELNDQLRESERELKASQAKVSDLNKLLDRAQVEAVKSMNRVAQLEVQLQEAKTQVENSNLRIKQLEDQIESLEEEYRGRQSENKNLIIIYKSEVEVPVPTVTFPLPPRSNSPVSKTNGEIPCEKQDSLGNANTLKSEIESLRELLTESRENKAHAEKEVARFKAELEDARNNVKRAADDSNLLRQQLQAAQLQDKEKSDVVSKLQDQLKHAELSSRDVQEQIAALKERLSEEQMNVQSKQEDIDKLRQQLMDAQHNYKQAHNEAEQLRNKLEWYLELQKRPSADNTSTSVELQLVHEECDTLKRSIQNLESMLQDVRNEKARLQEEMKRMTHNKRELDSSSTNVPSNVEVDPLHSDEAEKSKQELLMAYSEIIRLKEKCSAYNDETSRLRRELDMGNQDMQITAFKFLPLVIATIGIILIFYPKLAIVTATLDPSLPT